MNEENKTPEEGTEVSTQPEYSPVEIKAMEMGWRPKEEFNGDEESFVEAKEFVSRKPFFDKIEVQGKQLKAAMKTIEAFKLHYGKVKETEYQRALSTLKQERERAIEDGDGKKYTQLDEEIKEVEAQVEEVRAVATAPVEQGGEDHPAFQSWKQRNDWYVKDEDMRAYADGMGTRLAQQGKPPEDVLKIVEAKVRDAFPHKFTNPNKRQAPNVNSSTDNTSRNKSETVQMNAMEKQLMDNILATTGMKREEYLASFKEANVRFKKG